MKFLKKGISYILHAVFFFSRIPVGRFIKLDEKILIKSRVLAPLVGFIIGALSAGAFIILLIFFGKSVAILLSMLVTIILTGSFHEDALADSVDGFGAGGHTTKSIIEIMKDSRIGTYGTMALIFAFSLSFYSLDALPLLSIPVVILFAHTGSRFSAIPLMVWLSYVRHDSFFEKATKKHERDITLFSLFLSFLFVCIIGIWLFGAEGLWFIGMLLIVSVITGWYYQKRLGGVTGDCFGATIKIAEICCYLLAVLLYKI